MLVKEVNENLIGKKVSFNFTGLRSTGIVTEIVENEYSKGVKVKFDNPIVWGEDNYTTSEFTSRKFDDFGSLGGVFVIPNKGELVTFIYASAYRKEEIFIGYFEGISKESIAIDMSLNKETHNLCKIKEVFDIQKFKSLKLASQEEKELFDNEVKEYINC